MTNGFQPFLIGELKTGLFNYLDPWQRPQDAFEPLENAFVYRGTLQKRQGYTVFGKMPYPDIGPTTIDTGNGGQDYNGTLSTLPVLPGSFTATDGVESFSDNGFGILNGSAGGYGTIAYNSGVWTLHFNANVVAATPIVSTYVLNSLNPIMGLKLWTSDQGTQKKLVALDTRRAAVYDDGLQQFVFLTSVSQVIWVADGTATSFSNIATGWPNYFTPTTITLSDGTDTIQDNGLGVFLHGGNPLPDGTNFSAASINYAAGTVSVTFVAPPAAGIRITLTGTLSGDYFTGDYTNFFNSTNWKGPNNYPQADGYLYLTNNIDPITLYDGSTNPGTLSRPPFSIDAADQAAFINNIGTTLAIDVYKNRLLLERPTIINAGAQNGIGGQSVRYSSLFDPTNLVADVSGNGGELSAPTDDLLMAPIFLRDQLIIFFTESTWFFQFTGSDFEPFRWARINNTKATNAPYGAIDYDERVTSMGAKGLIACDGVNVQRYDINVIDQFSNIDQTLFAQCYGLRFDTINQSWMLYPSTENLFSVLSSKILVFNFLENTWATYNIPLSCLGIYYITKDVTWASLTQSWEDTEIPWNSYLNQKFSPSLLGGSHSGGFVYLMDDGVTDNTNPFLEPQIISTSCTSTRWNPFSSVGQKVQFGWIDYYYTIDTNVPPAQLTIVYYTDNSESPTLTRTLTLDGPFNASVAWKRIYINNIGEFLTQNISDNSNASWKILGQILWAKPAGRFTP